MGIIKNMFLFDVGNKLEKDHSFLGGTTLVALNTLAENEKTKNKKQIKNEKLKEGILDDLRVLYNENKNSMGSSLIERYNQLYVNIINIESDKLGYYSSTIIDFVRDCSVHIYAVDTIQELVDKLNQVPKEKLKEGLLDNVNKMFNCIKESTDSLETIDIWNDLTMYLVNNNIEIENLEKVKERLINKYNGIH